MTDGNGKVSLRAWCISRSVPWSTGQKAAAAGRLTRDARGRVDPAVADLEWERNNTGRVNSRVAVPVGPVVLVADAVAVEQARELMLAAVLGQSMRQVAPRLVGKQAPEITRLLLGTVASSWCICGRRWNRRWADGD